MTVTTKNAKNGARLYYVDSKRVSRQIALEVAAQNRAGNPFVIEYDTEQTHFFVNAPSKKFVYTSRDTYTELDTRIDNYKGYTLYIGTHEIHTFYDKNPAKELLAQIEDAFINGEHGIKVTLDGTIGILPDAEPELPTNPDATVAEENAEVISRDENGEVEKIKSGNYIYKIRNTEYSAGVKHFWELQHEVAGLDEGAAIAIARSLHGAEFQAELIRYLEGEMVDEYAISEDAFNFAVEHEIEEAAIVAGSERAIARILANETLKIRYDKAKTQVKYERYENGYCGWYFKGKNRDNWECNVTKATACLTRYGLSRFEFIIFSENEPAVIDNNGYDETAFDLLPTVDELNDVDDEAETYTLTIYTDVWTDGDNTFVKNYDTCRHLHISGKYLIGKHSWKLTRGGKTIATGDGVKDFCHFITCEFDVSERFAEIADVKSASLEICGENIWFRNGKCIFVYSPKYHASFYVEAAGIDGNEHYEINKSDERGKFTRFEFVTEEEFFNTLERRGGCTVDNGEVEYMGDAQAILVATFIDGTSEGKCFETADAAIAFARKCEKDSLIKRGYVMGDDKHYGNEVIYEFSKRTQAILNDELSQLIRQRENLNSRLRNGLLTADEFKADAGEVDAAIRYVELQIDALKAGDNFNYAAAC